MSEILSGEQTREHQRYLIFKVGEETYATPLLTVREVVGYQLPKVMPNMQNYFSGVINIRGNIVGVVDLRIKFVVDPKVTPKTAMLVCDTDGGPIAAVVDQVSAVIGLGAGDIEKNPPVLSKIPTEYLEGVAKIKNELATVVNLLKTLSADPLIQERKIS
jgi:purine-binding chemotaxis protein CheW